MGRAREMSYGNEFVLTLLTDDPEVARSADAAGVNRIGPDFERVGKSERQGGLRGTHRISEHDPECIPKLREIVQQGELFVRINPLHDGTRGEVERHLADGVDVVMLPAFECADEVARVLELVDRRATLVPLVETGKAVEALDNVVGLDGVEELHVGLNDLRISRGGDGSGRFDLIVTDYVEILAHRIRDAGLGLGIAGVARADDASLPIPAHLIYWQLPRLQATGTLLSRSFFRSDGAPVDVGHAIAACRTLLDDVAQADDGELQRAREELARHLREVASP